MSDYPPHCESLAQEEGGEMSLGVIKFKDKRFLSMRETTIVREVARW